MTIKISGGMIEDDTVVGNTYDKYGSANPIVKRIMSGFDSALAELVAATGAKDVHEIGCGEGYWCIRLLKQGLNVRGSDFSEVAIDLAQENARSSGFSDSLFTARNIYDIECKRDAAELIMCCEVFEHLEDPQRGLKALKGVVQKNLILSVPREPVWRILNMLRGKYITDLGNTPGHLQHWSSSSFQSFVSQEFEILEVRQPLPWTMLLCEPK